MKQDGTSGTFSFTGKNANAAALDDTLTGDIPFGATGAYASSFGGKSQASGKRSFACGTTTIAKGAYSFASGDNSVALGNDSFVCNYATTAQGVASFAQGVETQVKTTLYAKPSGSSSAGGTGGDAPSVPTTDVNGQGAAAMGVKTQSNGYGSLATGISTISNNTGTFTSGVNTFANGFGAVAVGTSSEADGTDSFAGGTSSWAKKDNSFAFGNGVQTLNEDETVVGRYNATSGKLGGDLFVVGKGESDSNRSDAFRVTRSGQAYLAASGTDNEHVARMADVYAVQTWADNRYLDKRSNAGEQYVYSTVKFFNNKATFYKGITVETAPTESNDVVRKNELDAEASRATAAESSIESDYMKLDREEKATGKKTFEGRIDVAAHSDGKGDEFLFSGIKAASANADRPVWFAFSDGSSIVNGTPTYDLDFKYNPSTNKLSVGSAAISGDLTVDGTLTANKITSVETKNLKVKNATVGLAQGNTEPITTYIGLYATKYDGTNDGGLVWDNTGTAYVGDVSVDSSGKITDPDNTLQPLLTRPDSSELEDGSLLAWNSDKSRAEASSKVEVSDSYLSNISANTVKRPYMDGNGEFSSMVNNARIDEKGSDYQYRMNFDGSGDQAYIDTHLSKTGSIYTAVTGDGAYLNTNVTGDKSFLFASLSNIGLDFIASGDKDKSGSLNYFLVQCSYDGKTNSSTVPLVYITHQTADSAGNMAADSSANKYGFAYDSVRNQIGYVERDSNGNLKFVDTKYVPQKSTSGTFVYAHSGDSQSEIEYTALPNPNTIVARAYDGNFCSAVPTANEHVVNKQYADANYVHKLSTSGYKLYAHSGDSQFEIDYDINATKSSAVQRDANGNVMMTAPQTALAGVNKQYADANYVDLSTNQTIVGEKHFSAGNTANANVVCYEDGTVFEKKTTIKAGGGDSVNINAGTNDTYFGKPVTLGSASKADYSVTSSSDSKTIVTKGYVDSASSSVQSKLQQQIDDINANKTVIEEIADTGDANLKLGSSYKITAAGTSFTFKMPGNTEAAASNITFDKDETAGYTIGGLKTGVQLKNMSIEDIIYKIFHKFNSPSGLTMTLLKSDGSEVQTSCTYTYPNASPTVTVASIKWSVTRGAEESGTLTLSGAASATSDVTGDTASGTITLSSPVEISASSSSKSFALTYAYEDDADEQQSIDASGKSISFTQNYKCYYGTASTNAPTATEVAEMSSSIRTSRNFTNTYTLSNSMAVYAYPTVLKELSSIKDANNFELLSGFNQTTQTIDGVEYYVYALNTANTSTQTYTFE